MDSANRANHATNMCAPPPPPMRTGPKQDTKYRVDQNLGVNRDSQEEQIWCFYSVHKKLRMDASSRGANLLRYHDCKQYRSFIRPS